MPIIESTSNANWNLEGPHYEGIVKISSFYSINFFYTGPGSNVRTMSGRQSITSTCGCLSGIYVPSQKKLSITYSPKSIATHLRKTAKEAYKGEEDIKAINNVKNYHYYEDERNISIIMQEPSEEDPAKIIDVKYTLTIKSTAYYNPPNDMP